MFKRIKETYFFPAQNLSEEGKVKKCNCLWFWGVFVAVFMGSVVSFDLACQGKMEQQAPVIFKLDFKGQIPPKVEAKFTAKILEDNAKLSGLMGYLRSARLENEDQKISALNKVQGDFANTYLKKPNLITDDGKVYSDWKEIIPVLKAMADKSPEIRIQSIDIMTRFMPYNLERAPDLANDVDLKMTIRTIVVIGSDEDPIFEGCLAHRRTCDPIGCDGEGIDY
jgi:hypothetical protein